MQTRNLGGEKKRLKLAIIQRKVKNVCRKVQGPMKDEGLRGKVLKELVA